MARRGRPFEAVAMELQLTSPQLRRGSSGNRSAKPHTRAHPESHW
jgi:hypothetical protein